MNTRDQRAEEVLATALEIPDAAARRAYLDRTCSGDEALRREVESLLAAHGQVGGFMSTSPMSGSAHAVLSEKAGDRIGRYKLLEQVGEGGFGVVWMAEQEEPVRRRVALKIIKLGMDTREVVARFEAERQALALMDHPNIAKVFDGGATDTGRPYFVMELVKGIPITEYCDAAKLPTAQRFDLFMQVCQAVQHAHQKGIIHRDLKPSNVLVTVQDNRPVPKVIDFGVAKATQARLTENTLFTRFNQWIGTPAYMSPEQAGLGSLDVDTRSDVYSLGVLLYELLTGRPPFDTQKLLAAGYEAVMRTIREEEPPKPSTRLSTLAKEELSAVAAKRGAEPGKLGRLVRGDLDWIVMKALEKDRARRYTTASEFAEDLGRYLRNLPVEARPPSAHYRLGRWVRRNRLLAGSVIVVGVTLVLASAVSGYLAYDANQARRVARTQQQAAEGSAAESRRRLVRNHVATGIRLQDSGSVFRALLWFAEAFRQDRPDASAEALHRYRIGAALHYAPRLSQLWVHRAGVQQAAFSPDGRRVVAACRDGTVHIWDVASGRAVATIRAESAGPESTVTADEGHTRTVRLAWNVTTKKDNQVIERNTEREVVRVSRADSGVVSAVFSADGHRVLTVCRGKNLRGHIAQVWDAATGKAITVPMEHRFPVQSARFSPDGNYIYTSSWLDLPGEVDSEMTGLDRGELCVWNAASGQPARLPVRSGLALSDVQPSPDGQWLAVGAGPVLFLWNLNAAEALRFMVKDGQPEVAKLAGEVPSGEGDPAALRRMPDLVRSPRALSGAAINLSGFAFSPNSQRLVIGCGDGTGYLWTPAIGKTIPLQRPNRTRSLRWPAGVQDVAFSPDGHRLLMVLGDDVGRIWDAETGGFVTETRERLNGGGQFSPDGRWLVGEASGQIFEVDSGQAVSTRDLHPGLVSGAAFSPEGSQLLLAGYDGTMRLWSLATGGAAPLRLRHDWLLVSRQSDFQSLHAATDPSQRALQTLRHSIRMPLPRPIFSPDSRCLATVSANGSARVWDALTGRAITPYVLLDCGLAAAAFTSDGQRFAVVGGDPGSRGTAGWISPPLGLARIFDAHTGRPTTPVIVHPEPLRSAAFSEDGRWLVTGSLSNAWLWDADTGQAAAMPGSLPQQLRSVVFSPDGQRAAITSGDTGAPETRLWTLATGQPGCPALSGLAWDSRLEFSPDSRWLVTVTPPDSTTGVERSSLPNSSVRIWEAGSGRPASAPIGCPGWGPRCFFTRDSSRLFVLTHTQPPIIWDFTDRRTLDPSAFRSLRYVVFTVDPTGRRSVNLSSSADIASGLRVYDIATGEALTPLLPGNCRYPLSGVVFSPDGGRLTAAGEDELHLWSLPKASLPLDELVQLAQLLSGEVVNLAGETDNLSTADLQSCWEKLRQQQAELFVTSREQARLWHERQAETCEGEELWFAAAFHLDQLVADAPDDVELRRRRAYAREQLAMEGLR